MNENYIWKKKDELNSNEIFEYLLSLPERMRDVWIEQQWLGHKVDCLEQDSVPYDWYFCFEDGAHSLLRHYSEQEIRSLFYKKWKVTIDFYDCGSESFTFEKKPSERELGEFLDSYLNSDLNDDDEEQEFSILPDDVDFDADEFVLPFTLDIVDFIEDGKIYVSKIQ